jgi:Cd2+/Zn2+-exporting ATPase
MTTETAVTIPHSLREMGDCFNCTARLRDDVSRLKGVNRVEKTEDLSQLLIEFDPHVTSLKVIESYVARQGLKLASHYGHEHYNIDGLDCPDCALKLEQSLSKIAGVTWVSLNYATSKIWFEYEPEIVTREYILTNISKAGYTCREPEVSTVSLSIAQSSFALEGLDCPDCAEKLQKKISQLDGTQETLVNFTNSSMTVRHDPLRTTRSAIIAAVEKAGYRAILVGEKTPAQSFPTSTLKNKRLLSTILSGFFIILAVAAQFLKDLLPLHLLSIGAHHFELAHFFYLSAILTGGYYVARSGYHSLISRTFDMNFLMSVAVLGALGIGEFAEGAIVVFLFSLGNSLQSYTMDKARNAIRSLMDLTPKIAHRKRGGRLQQVPVTELAIGDLIIVKPGEKVSVDGTISQGSSPIDESPITGESRPVDKMAGDRVFAGSLNGPGSLEVRVEKLAEDSTLSRIIYLVEEAQAQKAPSQNFIDTFSNIYTPLVIIVAVGLSIIPPLFLSLPFTDWFYRALMLLVIACPCALVLSTPVSIVSAIACASRKGVLIKGGAYLEEMGSIKAMAFDKTGTLTLSQFAVTDIVAIGESSSEDILAMAASLEMKSEHPLAKAILEKARKKDFILNEPLNLVSYPGRGLTGTVDGHTALIGNRSFLDDQGISTTPYDVELERLENEGKTAILIHHHTARGIIALADTPRNEASNCVHILKDKGFNHIMMLTGDNDRVASAIAKHLKVDSYKSAMLPEEKVDAIRQLLFKYEKVAMVGDGVNDAPALAASSVGIAMGAAGTDSAIEAADIALMSDDLLKLPFLVHLARRTLSTIKTNIVFSLIVKSAFIVFVFSGMANLWMAVAADMGTSLLVILYGMRLMNTKWTNPLVSEKPHPDHTETQSALSNDCGCDH